MIALVGVGGEDLTGAKGDFLGSLLEGTEGRIFLLDRRSEVEEKYWWQLCLWTMRLSNSGAHCVRQEVPLEKADI